MNNPVEDETYLAALGLWRLLNQVAQCPQQLGEMFLFMLLGSASLIVPTLTGGSATVGVN